MAIDSKRIRVSELDFDEIKSNLKSFLRGQDKFSDYDFEGSGLSILLDVLAYNTHYNALYTNLAVNEMFLDSASKRASVVSIAKQLGYTPQSAVAPAAYIRFTVTNPTSHPRTLTLPRNSVFSTKVDNVAYNFYTVEDTTIVSDGTTYVFDNIKIVEGTPLTYRYTVASGQKYILPNANVDMSTLKVRVQESATSDTFVTYIPATSLVDLTSTSKVYFSKEIDGGLYEIQFGDGIISSALSNGNIVHLDYFTTNNSSANGARTFKYEGSNLIGGVGVVTLITAAAGGIGAESIDSIKFNAPRIYTAQNRAVTTDDYKALIYANFPNVKSISVWGGEDNTPPVYGKTFICVKPYNVSKLTLQQKSDITTTLLNSRNVVSITPEIVDPEYLNIALDVTVYYNDRETTKSPSQIASMVTDTIFAYDDNDLQRFDGVFRFSKLSRLIDGTEPAIVSNITTVLMRRKLQPRYNVSAEYTLNLINPIYSAGVAENAIISTGFYIKGGVDDLHYLEDDGLGNIRLFRYVTTTNASITAQATKFIVNDKIGTVDYANGIINIKNLNITAITGIDFEISIKPQSNDIVSAYTAIAEIARDHLTVTAIPDKTINGDLRGGKNYVFTSSRN